MIFYTISSLVFWWYSRYMTQLIHEWQGLDTEQSEVLDMSIWVSASNSSTHLEIFEGLAGYERWSIRQNWTEEISTSLTFSKDEKWSTTFEPYVILLMPIWLTFRNSIIKHHFKHENLLLVLINVCLCFLHFFQ